MSRRAKLLIVLIAALVILKLVGDQLSETPDSE